MPAVPNAAAKLVTMTDELPDVIMTLELPDVTITLELPAATVTMVDPVNDALTFRNPELSKWNPAELAHTVESGIEPVSQRSAADELPMP